MSKKEEKIAVICVHGVADQKRFETSRYFAIGMADEFPPPSSSINDVGSVNYIERRLHLFNRLESFDEPTNKVDSEYPAGDIVESTHQLFDTAPGIGEEKSIRAASATNVYATAKKLDQFEPNESDRIYETNVIETNVNKQRTDFFEVYWGDLSRVKGSFFQIVASIYRLIFVLCRMSNNVRDFGNPVFNSMTLGSIYRSINYTCTYFLAIIVPALNLCLVGIGLTLVPYFVFQEDDTSYRIFGCGLLFAAVIWILLFHRFFKKGQPTNAAKTGHDLMKAAIIGIASYVFIALVCYCILHFLFNGSISFERSALLVRISLLAWFAIFAICLFLLGSSMDRQYGEQSSRPVFPTVFSFAVIIPCCFVSTGSTIHDSNLALVWCIYFAQFILFAMGVAWTFWVFLSFITVVWSCLVKKPWRLANAVWTTQVMNFVSGTMMFLVTVGIWFVVVNLGLGKVFVHAPNASRTQLLEWKSAELNLSEPFKSIQKNLPSQEANAHQTKNKTNVDLESIPTKGSPGINQASNSIVFLSQISALTFSPAVIGIVFAATLMLSGLLSAIFAESPSNRVHPYGKPSRRGATYDHIESQALGMGLSRGYRRTGYWVNWIFAGTLLVMLLLYALLLPLISESTPIKKTLLSFFSSFSLWAVGIFATIILGIATKSLPFSSTIASGLDVASDVVNWLRFSPVKRNVASQIYARYDSLLKHISNQGYTHVVILAHSLGSLITVDLLRYWQAIEEEKARQQDEKGPQNPLHGLRQPSVPGVLTNENIDIDLVTFGSPLNQLLGLRFTTLYGWCRSEQTDSSSEPNRWRQNELICNPDELLGVKSWSNIYCSGDYVGRHLWHPNSEDEKDSNWTPTDDQNSTRNVATSKKGKKQIEFCVGAGAHTKYGAYHPPAVNKFRFAVRALLENRDKFLKGELENVDQAGDSSDS